jgi:DNA-binding MarR family transcriptional regulator
MGELTPSDLATGEKVTTQAVAAALRSLEGRELVTRAGHPSDGRRVVVRLTPRGTETLSGRERSSVAHLADALTRDFTPKEREQLAAAVPLLERLAERL